jgi:DNA adenine methylase
VDCGNDRYFSCERNVGDNAGAEAEMTSIMDFDYRHVTVRPFVKWAGGKGQLLPELDKLIPRQFNRYFEPFLGSGALFFHMMSKGMRFDVYLSDTTDELITAYRAVRDNVKGVIQHLQTYEAEYKKYPPYSKEQRECYLQLRNERNNTFLQSARSSDVETAVRFIALNKTCFCGLYRVNGKGGFNVPPGYWKNKKGEYINPLICDSSNLENVSHVLRLARATIFAADYKHVVDAAQQGDFVYFDPPYEPVSSTANFTGYTKEGFGRKDQMQLADVFRKLVKKGCFVLLSNSDTPFIRELYSGHGFTVREVEDVKRAINCKASKRMGHKELLIPV